MSVLLNNVSSDTVSNTFSGKGGSHIVYIRADNFGGGTLEMQIASPNDSAVGPRFNVLVDGALTGNGQFKIDYLPSGYLIRANLTGSTSPVNVFAEIA